MPKNDQSFTIDVVLLVRRIQIGDPWPYAFSSKVGEREASGKVQVAFIFGGGSEIVGAEIVEEIVLSPSIGSFHVGILSWVKCPDFWLDIHNNIQKYTVIFIRRAFIGLSIWVCHRLCNKQSGNDKTTQVLLSLCLRKTSATIVLNYTNIQVFKLPHNPYRFTLFH